MSKRSDGGPAFGAGMTVRDYFAIHASDEDLQDWIPGSLGQCCILLTQLGYNATDYENSVRALRPWARYRFADAMLRARDACTTTPTTDADGHRTA